ncbi:hypothetical protein PM082_020288 [Marasmius tenuissimus]|nr:hypothetical protein PM082_020288 [Marasmius tenuissimus]
MNDGGCPIGRSHAHRLNSAPNRHFHWVDPPGDIDVMFWNQHDDHNQLRAVVRIDSWYMAIKCRRGDVGRGSLEDRQITGMRDLANISSLMLSRFPLI